jgi:hypothetical protein
MHWWGLNIQRFLDPVLGWGLWSLVTVSHLPAAGRRLEGALQPLGAFLTKSIRAPWGVAIAGALIVWMMPDRLWFVGDFLMRQGSVEAPAFSGIYTGALPLDVFLHRTLLRPFAFGSSEAANTALRLLGVVEAAFFALIALRFAQSLGVTGSLAVLSIGLVFFGGYLTMFTGLGKPASELCLVTAAFATVSIRALLRNRGFVWAGIILAASLWLHRSAVILIPAWLTLTWFWLRRDEGRQWKRLDTWAGLTIPILSAAVILPLVMSIATAYDLSRHVLTRDVQQRGGIVAAAFAPSHVRDLINLIVVLSPTAPLIPILLVGSGRQALRRAQTLVLLVLACSFIPLLLFVHPQHGIFRDWDVFAPAGVAFSMLVAYLLVEILSRFSGWSWIAVPAVLLAIVSTLQWLAINRMPVRGLTRLRAYVTELPRAVPSDQAMVWDFLATRNLRLGHWADAVDAAKHAVTLAPHRRNLLMWAIAETMREDYAAAAIVYRRMIEQDSKDPLAWLGLAGAAIRLGDNATADTALTRLRSYDREGPEMRQIRRHLAFFPQVWPRPLE